LEPVTVTTILCSCADALKSTAALQTPKAYASAATCFLQRDRMRGTVGTRMEDLYSGKAIICQAFVRFGLVLHTRIVDSEFCRDESLICKALSTVRRAVNEVRACRQPQDREGAQDHDSAGPAARG